MQETFWSATILLILVTDPLGNIPLAIHSLEAVSPERRLKVLMRECLIAFGILLLFMLAGDSFLRMLRLSDTAIALAGGVVLFLIALKMIFPTSEGVFGGQTTAEPFIVPLAVPYIAGPSALATVMLLVAREPQRWLEWSGALAVAILVSFTIFAFANRIRNWVGDAAVTAFERLMGLILIAISVEMMMAGVSRNVQQLKLA
jgi:MarC family membrane protein